MQSSIPTPTLSQFSVGPLTIHLYALCIIAGITVAIWLGDKRFSRQNENLRGVVSEVAVVAVPAGIIGGRIYHVISSPAQYFGANGNPIDALKIWQGGLGIWGAISLGVAGAYFSYRRQSRLQLLPNFGVFLDAIAPGILLAQAIGRLGNWFNGELFGRPLESWWALEIPYSNRPSGFGLAETFHPTFAYEALWATLIAFLLIRFAQNWSTGATFTAYVSAYSFGRFFIEGLRIDFAEFVLGMRINQLLSATLFICATVIFIHLHRRDLVKP